MAMKYGIVKMAFDELIQSRGEGYIKTGKRTRKIEEKTSSQQETPQTNAAKGRRFEYFN